MKVTDTASARGELLHARLPKRFHNARMRYADKPRNDFQNLKRCF